MTKKILLVNAVKSNFPPMALMKYSTYYKKLGYKVKYQDKINMLDDYNPDLILISTLFTWDFREIVNTTLYLRKQYPQSKIYVGGICASLLKKELESAFKNKNIILKFGLQKSIDNEKLDYSISDKNYSIGYTTRGCPRKCSWCMVWRLEPEYIEYKKEHWIRYIEHKRVLLYDNNILKSTIKHFKEVVEYMKMNDISYDFNQAMDARLITQEHFNIFKNSKISPIRFAFDSMETDKYIQIAMKKSIENGFTDGSIYLLYNFNDSPEEYYYRLKEVVKLWYFDAYPMKFQLLNAKEKDIYIGKHWNEKRLNNFKLLINTFFRNSLIGRSLKIKKFERIFGKNSKEFKTILDLDDIKTRNEHIKTKKIDDNTEIDSQFNYSETEIEKIIKDSEGLMTRNNAIQILKGENNGKKKTNKTTYNAKTSNKKPNRFTRHKDKPSTRGLCKFF
jgi:hypothetical protein